MKPSVITRIKSLAIGAMFTGVLASLLILMEGCSTTSGGGASTPERIQKIAASIEYAAQIATYAVVKDRPSAQKHFASAAAGIREIVQTGSLSPESIQDVIFAIGSKDPNVALAVNGAFVIYRIWWSDQLKDRIDANEHAKTILLALARGIELGGAPSTRSVPALPQLGLPPSIQEAFDAHVRRYLR